MLPSFLGIVAQGGGGPPPPAGVLISGQTLDVTYLTTTPAETFNFGGGSTYLTNGESVTSFDYLNDPTTVFSLDLTGLTALTTANVSSNVNMTTAPDFTGCTALTLAYVNGCAVSDTNLLAMCVQIYDDAPANGTLAMEGGSNGSFDGQALPGQITNLQGNGWTVTFNDNNPP